MKRKTLNTRMIAMLLCCVMLVGTLAGCTGYSGTDEGKTAESESASPAPSESQDSVADVEPMGYTRKDLEADLANAKQMYHANTDDFEAVYAYAGLLYQNGDFPVAKTVLESLLLKENPAPEIIAMAAQVEYILGNYAQSEKLYLDLVENHNKDWGTAAEAGLQMVYYQTNEYEKASHLFEGQDFDNPFLDMMKAFDDELPYQIDWNGKDRAVVPFVVGNPLPVVPIEVNGVRLNAVIDTGAPMMIVEETLAADVGIEPIAKDMGQGASGASEITYGKADSVNLGGIDVHNAPILIASVHGFTGYYDDIEVHAIIGTNFLQRFMPIMDYATGQLVLVPRTEEGKTLTNQLLEEEKILEEIPFALESTHYMYAKGSVNGYENLNMFVDSGLPDENGEAAQLSKSTMELLNIPTPEMTVVPNDKGGLGDEDFESGSFELSSYGLGNLKLDSGLGIYDSTDVVSVLTKGFGIMTDVLISHHYLKQYKLYMDFDSMTMTFCEK